MLVYPAKNAICSSISSYSQITHVKTPAMRNTFTSTDCADLCKLPVMSNKRCIIIVYFYVYVTTGTLKRLHVSLVLHLVNMYCSLRTRCRPTQRRQIQSDVANDVSSAEDVELDNTKDKSKQNARLSCKECHLFQRFFIYTTKIEAFVSPPNISETVAVRILKLAHRPCIVSTTIKLISKQILLSILSILLKTIQRIETTITPNIAHINMPGHKLVLPSGRSICIILFSLLPIHPHIRPCWHGTTLVCSNYTCKDICDEEHFHINRLCRQRCTLPAMSNKGCIMIVYFYVYVTTLNRYSKTITRFLSTSPG